jgi:RNA polymerase sigma-70 factor (ECF subfamily)
VLVRTSSNAGGLPSPPLEIDALYREHGRQVTRWVAHLGGPMVDVEDLVQEVFLAAHQHRGRFRGDSRVSTWLYSITARLVYKARRRARWRRWLSSDAAEAAEEMVSRRASPVELLEQRQAQVRVYRILDRLSERQRTVLALFEIEGHSGEEIAALTHQRVETVWVQLHRARAAFLREIEKTGRDSL